MHKKLSSQKGFSVLAALVIIAILALIGFAGWRVYDKDTTKENNESVTNKITLSVIESGKKILPNGVADPTITKTDAGYRMYINQQSGGPSGYLTYISTDGISWTKEHDIIIPGVATGRAVSMNGGIRFYYPGTQPINPTDPTASMFSTFSENGIDFNEVDSAFEPRDGYYVEGPTVFQLEDGSWQMYFNENSITAGNQRDGEIFGAKSSDGVTWVRDDTPTLVFDDVESSALGDKNAPWSQILHPFVLKNPEGGFIMFYNSHSEIFTATSEDGLNWDKLGKLGIHGADVDGYFQSDGKIRIFYGDYSESTGGVVYTAIVQVN